MTRQNATQTQQQAPTSSILSKSKGGILQRKCESCGQHTIAGGECSDCNKKKSNLQRKLSIGSSDDPLELEADRVADQVMAMSANSVVNNSPLRIQRFTGESTGQTDMTAPESVDRVLSSPGSPLEPGLQQDMGQRFGHDFSQVRVHTGDEAARSAQDVNAKAYTVGDNLVFGSGQYSPATNTGKKLLAHELTHVIQQSKGVKVIVQRTPWGVCPPGEALSATNPHVYVAAELLGITHYKSRNPGHGIITNEELAGNIIPPLSKRERKIFDQIREGFHRDKSPQKRRSIASPDNVIERPEATGEALEPGFQLVQQLLQPDIIDLTSLEIYDVTTTKQRDKKLNKIQTTTYVPRLKALTGLDWKAGKSLAPMVPFIVPMLPSKDKVICFGTTDFDTHPGVITYEGLKYDISKLKNSKEGEKPKEAEKAKKAKGGAYNFGFGVSILSSSAGVGNAGVGVSIMSDGVSVGTLGGGIIYNSQGVAIGVVSGGMSKDSMSAGAGTAGLGESEGNIGASAGTANVGTSKDNVIASAGTAGKGDTEGKMAAQAGNASNADNQGGNGDATQEAMSQAAKIEEALKNANPQQRKLLQKMAQKQGGSYQTPSPEWVNDFLQSTKNITDADVDTIANSTTGDAKNDLPKIKQGIQQSANKVTEADKADGADGKGDKDADIQKAKADAAVTDDKYKRLNDTSRKKISEAPGPVSSLFKSFAAGQKGDLVLTDEMVARFFEVVPTDLTQEEAKKLADGMISSKGSTPDQIIAELKKSIEQVRKSNAAEQPTKTTPIDRKMDEKEEGNKDIVTTVPTDVEKATPIEFWKLFDSKELKLITVDFDPKATEVPLTAVIPFTWKKKTAKGERTYKSWMNGTLQNKLDKFDTNEFKSAGNYKLFPSSQIVNSEQGDEPIYFTDTSIGKDITLGIFQPKKSSKKK
jgi:hypothetical protein